MAKITFSWHAFKYFYFKAVFPQLDANEKWYSADKSHFFYLVSNNQLAVNPLL
jgi:hypothetical protein